MGVPRITGGEGPGWIVPRSEMEKFALLEWQIGRAADLAGPKPLLQPSMVAVGEQEPTLNEDGLMRGGGITVSTPDADAMVAAYVAEVEAWNDRFKFYLAELRK